MTRYTVFTRDRRVHRVFTTNDKEHADQIKTRNMLQECYPTRWVLFETLGTNIAPEARV